MKGFVNDVVQEYKKLFSESNDIEKKIKHSKKVDKKRGKKKK